MIYEGKDASAKPICAGCGIDCDPRESLCLKCYDGMMENEDWQSVIFQEEQGKSRPTNQKVD